ncbi:hypothetical protein EI94DRAFT_1744055, partial [Lactarius quietus]
MQQIFSGRINPHASQSFVTLLHYMIYLICGISPSVCRTYLRALVSMREIPISCSLLYSSYSTALTSPFNAQPILLTPSVQTHTLSSYLRRAMYRSFVAMLLLAASAVSRALSAPVAIRGTSAEKRANDHAARDPTPDSICIACIASSNLQGRSEDAIAARDANATDAHKDDLVFFFPGS